MSKLYYSSSEVSTMLELEPSVLRFWEDQFGQLRIKRNRAGKRMYREKDIELIRTIKQLTRDEGYTIAGARKKLQESAANRGAEKADRKAERASSAAEKAAAGPVVADPGEQPATSPEQAVPGATPVTPGERTTSDAEPAAPGEQATTGADPADPGEQADPGPAQAAPDGRKATPADFSSQNELIQWLRTRLIEIRNSMD